MTKAAEVHAAVSRSRGLYTHVQQRLRSGTGPGDTPALLLTILSCEVDRLQLPTEEQIPRFSLTVSCRFWWRDSSSRGLCCRTSLFFSSQASQEHRNMVFR